MRRSEKRGWQTPEAQTTSLLAVSCIAWLGVDVARSEGAVDQFWTRRFIDGIEPKLCPKRQQKPTTSPEKNGTGASQTTATVPLRAERRERKPVHEAEKGRTSGNGGKLSQLLLRLRCERTHPNT